MNTKSVIMIETAPDVCEQAEQLLGDAGYEVVIAASGRQALDLLEKQTISVVVVLGRHLPDMSSKEFVAHLRDDWRLQDTMIVLSLDPVIDAEILRGVHYAF